MAKKNFLGKLKETMFPANKSGNANPTYDDFKSVGTTGGSGQMSGMPTNLPTKKPGDSALASKVKVQQLKGKDLIYETNLLVKELSMINKTINAGPGFVVTSTIYKRAVNICTTDTGPVRDLALTALGSYIDFFQYLTKEDI